MRRMIITSKLHLLLAIVLLLPGILNAQDQDASNIKFTQGSVNESATLSLGVPLGNYKGRGIDLPVSLNYSSSVWRIDHINDVQNYNTVYGPIYYVKQSVTQAIYSEYSTSGWKSSLDLPIIEWPKFNEVYAYNGKASTITTSGDCFGWRVARVIIHMPDGATHELRKSDVPYNASSIDMSGTFYAVDGSRMRFDATGVNSGTIYTPDGTRYVLGDTTSVPGDTISRIIDRNGNTLTYTASTRTWSDTVGRVITNPVPPVPTPTDIPYSLPGISGVNLGTQNYVFKWRNLQDALTPVNNQTPPLRYIAKHYLPYPGSLPTGTNGNNYPQPQSTQYGYLFRSEYVYNEEEQGDSLVPTMVVGKDPYLNQSQAQGSLFNPVVLAEIVLPDQIRSYKFSYNVYGEIDKVIYPTGAFETYSIDSPDGGGYSVSTAYATYVATKQPYVQAQRLIKSRKMSEDGTGSDILEWQYLEDIHYGGILESGGKYKKTSIIAPDKTRSEFYKYDDEKQYPASRFGFQSTLNGMVVQKKSYSTSNDGLGGSLLRRELTDFDQTANPYNFAVQCGQTNFNFPVTAYRNARSSRSTGIIFEGDSALAQSTFLTYHTGNELTTGVDQKFAYTYHFAEVTNLTTAQTGTIGQIPSGYLARYTETTYSSDSVYQSANILGIPTSVQVLNPSGTPVSRSEMTYDDSGYITSGSLCAPKCALPTTSKVWDSSKNLAMNDPNAYLVTHATFDVYGNRTIATDAKGFQTATTYDSTYHAFPVSVTSEIPDPTPNGTAHGSSTAFTTGTEYYTDNLGRNTGIVKRTKDINDQYTYFYYDDPFLRPTKVIAPNGQQTETIYGAGTSAATRTVTVRSQIDANEWTEATSSYDGLGRTYLTDRKDVSDPAGDSYTYTCYDDMGRVLKTSSPFRNYTGQNLCNTTNTLEWTVPEYDDLSRTTKVTMPVPSPSGTPGTITITYGLSTNGVIGTTKTITDETNRQRTGITDALGNMVRVIEDPTGQNLTTDYTFDILGNLRKTIQGNQNRFFMYDSLGRVLYAKQVEQDANPNFSGAAYADPITSNNQWSVRYTYDNDSNILTTTNARNQTITATYDRLNRLTFRNYSDTTPDVDFFYDGTGLSPVSVEFGRGKVTRVYSSVSETRYTGFDSMGRVEVSEQITGGQSFPFIYSYNLAGALIQETYPSGRVVKNTVNTDGELAQVQSKKNSGAGFFTYADAFRYNASGAVTKMQLGNGYWETASYNERQQVIQMGLGTLDSQQNILKLNFGYEGEHPDTVPADRNNGSMRKQTITVPDLCPSNMICEDSAFTAEQTYTYDGLNRIKVAEEKINGATSWKQVFDFDRYGNKNFVTGTGQTTTLGTCATAVCNPAYSTANNNRFATNQGAGYTNAYNYDADGSLIKDATGQQFGYDAEGRQNAFFAAGNNTGTPTQNYAFDGEGRRVIKGDGGLNGNSTIFVYDAGGKLAGEYQICPQLCEMNDSPRVSYMTTDHLGSPRIVTDQNGAIVSRKDFAAFGDETITPERTSVNNYTPSDIRQDYTGYQKDEESGLEYAQARYYNTQHGRFTSVDPLPASAAIRNPQSFNRYSYVLNSPYKFTDPLGLMEGATTMGGCSAEYSSCSGFVSDAIVHVGSWNDLSKEQRRLFTSYYVNKFGAPTAQQGDEMCGDTCEDTPSSEDLAAAYWNQSADAANAGNDGKDLLSQDQLTTFIGVTSMWEANHVSEKVAVVTEIVKDSSDDGFRLRGSFDKGGGEYIRDKWFKSPGLTKGNGKFTESYRERDDGNGPNGQFTMTKDLKEFDSDVDYHGTDNPLHLTHENSDIRQNHIVGAWPFRRDHRHLQHHIERYGAVPITVTY